MGVSNESIGKIFMGNRFHVKLRILRPGIHKQILRVKSWKAKEYLLYLNIDMCKFESPQRDESRSQSADSSKAYRKPRAFNCLL